MTFEEWEHQVNREFVRRLGLHRDDFPDYCWYNCYENNMSPAEAYLAWREECLEF